MDAQEEIEPRYQGESVHKPQNPSSDNAAISEDTFLEESRFYTGRPFHQMFENAPFGVAVVNSDLRLVAVNPSLCRMLLFTEHELAKLTVGEIIHPDDVDKEQDLAERLFSGDIAFFTMELRYIRSDRQPFWINLTASPIRGARGQIGYCLLMSEDINERKLLEEAIHEPAPTAIRMEQAENAALESNERMRVIVETASDPIIGADSSGNIMMWNSAATRTFGYTAEEAMNRPVTMIMPERFAALHERAMHRAVTVGRLYYAKHVREVFGLRKDGTEFPAEVSISAGKAQETMFFTAIVRDITERKRKDEELRRAYEDLESRVVERTAELVKLNKDLTQEIADRKRIETMLTESEQLYHTLVEEVPDVIFILDHNGRFTYLNLPAEAVLKRALKEILDTPLTAYVVPEEKEKVEAMFSLDPDSIWDEEIRLLDGDGGKKFARIRCKALSGDGKDKIRYEGVMRDITRRRRLEEQLKESREQLLEKIQIIDELYAHIVESGKAKAIAEHTAEVAHELRQPLTIIGGFARRIARQLDSCNIRSDAGQAEAVRIISSEIQRLEKILGTLIDFTRRESVSREMACANCIIKKVLGLYKEVVEEKNLRLNVNLRSEVGDIFVDPERFEQVVRNLVSNAIDASPVGETIQIETGVSIPSSKAVETAALASERYFQMKVRNHGPAIREEDLHTIFSPFFTTKDYGTGIGLTVSKKIIEAHNGSLSVHSDESGTTFTVWIPLMQREAAVQHLR